MGVASAMRCKPYHKKVPERSEAVQIARTGVLNEKLPFALTVIQCSSSIECRRDSATAFGVRAERSTKTVRPIFVSVYRDLVTGLPSCRKQAITRFDPAAGILSAMGI